MHTLESGLVKTWNSGYGEIDVVWSLSLARQVLAMYGGSRRDGRIERCNRRAGSAKMRRPHASRVAHMRWIHQKLMRVMLVGLRDSSMMAVVSARGLGQTMAVTTRMLKLWPMMLVRREIITVLLMALIGRMRLLDSILDVVVPHSIVARQRVCYAWVPPERNALAGRRLLERKNWFRWCLERRPRPWRGWKTGVLRIGLLQ